jgi:hypothetical protein
VSPIGNTTTTGEAIPGEREDEGGQVIEDVRKKKRRRMNKNGND